MFAYSDGSAKLRGTPGSKDRRPKPREIVCAHFVLAYTSLTIAKGLEEFLEVGCLLVVTP